MTRSTRAPAPRVVLPALPALLALLAGCGAPEPAPEPAAATSPPRDTPELSGPRPKLLPPEAVAGAPRSGE